jgi:hypothetical protein
MNLFVPVLYICLNGHCEFLQQLAVYPDEEECRQVVMGKKEWYEKTTTAKVEVTCIAVPAKVMEEDVKPKPKRRETI